MSFIKNLNQFIEECRQYRRKTFSLYQWNYIQNVLNSHQYMAELLGRFGSSFFDKLYDASVLFYEGVENHAHTALYKSQKTRIFETIKNRVKKHACLSKNWDVDKDLLETGHYRQQLLAWPEIAQSQSLTDYVNFLFDEFENKTITTSYWVILMTQWAGTVFDKEPFIAALRDSQAAYEQDDIELGTYDYKSYSCMGGLEDRISHFYGYLYEESSISQSRIPLSSRYITAILEPFVAPCSEHGFKPTPLLYGLYLQARFGHYSIQRQRVPHSVLHIPQQQYEYLKNIYIERQYSDIERLCPQALSLQGLLNLRMTEIAQPQLSPWRSVLMNLWGQKEEIDSAGETLRSLLADCFDKECLSFLRETVIDDYVAVKLKHFGLESCVKKIRKYKTLLSYQTGLEKNIDDICQALALETGFSEDWVELLRYLPGAHLFEQLDSWVVQGVTDAIKQQHLNSELESVVRNIDAYERKLFDNNLKKIIAGELCLTDYYYGSAGLLEHIARSLHETFMHDSDKLLNVITTGNFIFAQDSLNKTLIPTWLQQAGAILYSDLREGDDDTDLCDISIYEFRLMVEQYMKMGFDGTLTKILQIFPELYHHTEIHQFYINEEKQQGTGVLESLAQCCLAQSVTYYLTQSEAYWADSQRNMLYARAFNEALECGNIEFLEQLQSVLSLEQIQHNTELTTKKNILITLIESGDSALWQWFRTRFSSLYHALEKALPLRDHPIMRALGSERSTYQFIEQVVKMSPNFLARFLRETKGFLGQADRVIDRFFDYDKHDPLAFSILYYEPAISLFVSLPSYQEYLFDHNSFNILKYIEKSIEHTAYASTDILLQQIESYGKKCSDHLSYDRLIRLLNQLFIKKISLIKTHLELSEMTSERQKAQGLLQRLESISSIYLTHGVQTWIDAIFIENPKADWMGFFRKIGVMPESVFLQNALNNLWSKILSNRRNNNNFKYLILQCLEYGCWPHKISSKRILVELLIKSSSDFMLRVLKLYYDKQPRLLDTGFIIVKNNTQQGIIGLERQLIQSAILQQSFDAFHGFLLKMQPYTADLEYYVPILLSQCWWRRVLGNHETKDFDVALIAQLLGLSEEDSRVLNENIRTLKTKTARLSWPYIKQLLEVSAASKILLLLGMTLAASKEYKSPPYYVLTEALDLECWLIADFLIRKYGDIDKVLVENNAVNLKALLQKPAIEVLQLALSSRYCRLELQRKWQSYAQTYLIKQCWQQAQVLMDHIHENGWMTSQGFFDVWHLCSQAGYQQQLSWLSHWTQSHPNKQILLQVCQNRQAQQRAQIQSEPLLFSRCSSPTQHLSKRKKYD